MASILDAGLLSIFSGFFTFMLVYAFVWGVLSWKKPFGDSNRGTYAIIALMVALFVAIVPPVRTFVEFISPWYIAFALFLFFLLFLVTLFGLSSEKDFPDIIRQSRVYTWIIIVAVIIGVVGLAFSLGQSFLNEQAPATTTTTGDGGNVIGPGTTPGTVGPGTTTGVPQAGQPGSTATSNFQTNFMNTLIHPKVLGLLITMILSALAIYFLSSN
jgi:hypothetical protein